MDYLNDGPHSGLTKSCFNTTDEAVTFLIVNPVGLPISIVGCIMLTLTLIFGSTGSVLVIVCYARNRSLWTSTNAIIVNISISDLVMYALGVPLAMVVLVLNQYGMNPGVFACKIQTFGSSLSNVVTLLTLDAVTLNRYLAVVHPFAGSNGWTKRLDKALIVLSWIIGLLVAGVEAALPDSSSQFYEICLLREWSRTDDQSPQLKSIVLYVMMPMGFFSMLFVSVAYVRIICVVRNHKRKVNFETPRSHSPVSVVSPMEGQNGDMASARVSHLPSLLPVSSAPQQPERTLSLPNLVSQIEDTDSKQVRIRSTTLEIPATSTLPFQNPQLSANLAIVGKATSHEASGRSHQRSFRHNRPDMQATASKRSLYVVMAFLFAWFPLPTMIVISWCFPERTRVIDETITVLYCIMVSTRPAHPFLYANLSKEFNKEFQKFWDSLTKRNAIVL